MTVTALPIVEAPPPPRDRSPWDIAAERFSLRPTTDGIEHDPVTWLTSLFGGWFFHPFATHHLEFWDHIWGVIPNIAPDPYVAIWPRGHTKSTSAESAVVSLGCRGLRSYALYVSATQDLADDHVGNINILLESEGIEEHYPEMSDRGVGKYGQARGWRRQRLWTASGFVVDALGLDTAARGLKLGKQRPNILVLDEIDTEFDTPATTQKKLKAIARKILPALTDDAVIIGVQNLPLRGGVFGRLAGVDGVPRADILSNRILSGPIPAAENLEYQQNTEGKWEITNADPTWEGEPIEVLQRNMDTMGLTAFLAEKQHSSDFLEGSMYGHIKWQRCTAEEVPLLHQIEVWVDPAVTSTDKSDSHAVQCDGLAISPDGKKKRIYRLFSWERRATPHESLRTAIRVAIEYGSPAVGVETDQGGDTWQDTWTLVLQEMIDEAMEEGDEVLAQKLRSLRFKEDKASRQSGQPSKRARGARMLASYERGEIIHVIGTHDTLERALGRFPDVAPYDLADAAFWSWHHLMEQGKTTVKAPPKERRVMAGSPGRAVARR